ncbi:extracellular solute-binding protein [Kineococcus sp. R8]|uniref:ABC transporter substrate-binding protein n=1 Tax=Kineococcus siccus TaxID=2696567 RepID=UPI001412D2AA|nr:extracellular solute-binding protein [Kineococcus siccus]NAZ82903.1 extracellular solute-binding protein [Kineococcus siccus]
MQLSRRDALRGSGLAVLGLGLSSLAACSNDSAGTGTSGTTLWYWGGGLSDAVVEAAKQQFPDAGITPSKIGGDFKQKLQTAFTGGAFAPAITGVKGEDMAYFKSVAAKFTDLGPLGGTEAAATGLAWKWEQGRTADGKQIGYPIDIGPTAMFYRSDLFEQAGLPTDPTAVSAAVATWDGFYALGQELHGKVPATFPVSSLGVLWGILTGQTTQRYVGEDGSFTGDSEELHDAWRTAVRAQALGLNANAAQNLNPALADGTIGTEMGAAWHALDISDGAPDTAGKWRVADNPVKPTSIGGSFLAIPATTKDPQQAFSIIQWILSPENEAKGYADASIFPADPAAWTLPALTEGDAFFGGQKTIDIFGPAAQLVPAQFESPFDAAVGAPYGDELTKVETAGKDPEQAWTDAVAAARQVADRAGVK